MCQDHGLNTNGKLLRRFYEPLILLSVLDPTRGAHRPDLITDRGLQGREKLWRNFLDQLSFLCDSKRGGDTVTAVAAQRTVEHTVFWLASNSNTGSKAKKHVEWILSRLNSLYDADVEKIELVENEIKAHCIAFSSSRIDTSVSFLLRHIKESQPLDLTEGSEDEQLFTALKPFAQHRDNPGALCAYAYEFRRMKEVHILTRRHNMHESRGPWTEIRHNIGRLGCWIKAVKILLDAAQNFPQQLEGAKVDFVLPRGPVDIPPRKKGRQAVDIKGLIQRMIPRDQLLVAGNLVESLNELDVISPLTRHFQEIYSNFRPRPHAELLVLEHFFEHEFEFVNDDRYIGCSKPSCYCCSLYLKVHPGRFEPRACHGNLWPNWAPPIPLPVVGGSGKRNAQLRRPQDHHTFKLLQDMLSYVRDDVLDQIQSRRPRRNKLPDSTTGMSSVVMDSGLIKATYYAWKNQVDRNPISQPNPLVTELERRLEDREVNLVESEIQDDEICISDGAEADSMSRFSSDSSRSEIQDDEIRRNSFRHTSTIVRDSLSEDEDGGVLLFPV